MAKLWWIRNDPFGMFSAIFTIFLLVFAQYVMTKIVLLPWLGVDIHLVLFSACTLLSLISHTRCQFSDPGAVPSYFSPPELPGDIDLSNISVRPHNAPKICRACRTLKSHHTYHCKTCSRCIVRMDHHCPWVNNCVGIFNQKYFLLFLIYTAISCLYCAGLLIARFHSCTVNPKGCNISGVSTVLCILAFIEALVFGLFVIIMFFDQLSGVFFELEFEQQHFKTLLLQYEDAEQKGQRVFSQRPVIPPVKTRYEMLKEIFGGSFGPSWLSPFTSPNGAYDKFQHDLESTRTHAETVTLNFVKYVRNENMKQQQRQQQQQHHEQQQPQSSHRSDGHESQDGQEDHQTHPLDNGSPTDLQLQDFDSDDSRSSTSTSVSVMSSHRGEEHGASQHDEDDHGSDDFRDQLLDDAVRQRATRHAHSNQLEIMD